MIIKNLHLYVFVLLLTLYANSSIIGGDGSTRNNPWCIDNEREALLQFKEGLIDDSGLLSSWKNDDCCKWRGVECSNRHVVTLDLQFDLESNQPLRELRIYYVADASVQWKGRLSEYNRILGLLKCIDLSSNKLSGDIPREFSSLKGIASLNLSRNNLTGNIMESISEMNMLEVLDLSKNQLSGRLPSGLAQLNFLSILDLSDNNFTGKIPLSTQLQSFNASSYDGNPKLCGPPLLNKCPGEEAPSPPPSTSHGKDESIEEKLVAKRFYISFVFGFAVAFWGFVGPILLRRSWRHAYFMFLGKVQDWVLVTITIKIEKLRRMFNS